MKILSFLAIFICGYSWSLSNEVNMNLPEEMGKKLIRDLLMRKDYVMYVTDDFTGIHYAEAAMGYAAIKFSYATNNSKLLTAVSTRYAHVPGTENLLTAEHVDANVYGILPLQLYLVNHDKIKLKEGLALAEAQWSKPRKDGLSQQARYWIDDIWMVNSLQVQAYRATGRKIFLDRAALQTDAYLKELQQENGLFYHGKDAPFHWGRGNGWVAAGLAELLSELPADHPRFDFLVGRYRKMMTALLHFQAADGMWRQLVDKPESWEESSSTAMFGFAMAVGVQKGILPSDTYTSAHQNAWSALVTRVDDKGLLHDVCVGTGQSKDINYYLQRPRSAGDFHGQAPLLWFANVLLNSAS